MPPTLNAWLCAIDLIVYENLLVFIQFNTQIAPGFHSKLMIFAHVCRRSGIILAQKSIEKREKVV